jgi:hypothetical protein
MLLNRTRDTAARTGALPRLARPNRTPRFLSLDPPTGWGVSGCGVVMTGGLRDALADAWAGVSG